MMEIKHRNGLFCIGMMTSLILAGAIYVTTVYREGGRYSSTTAGPSISESTTTSSTQLPSTLVTTLPTTLSTSTSSTSTTSISTTSTSTSTASTTTAASTTPVSCNLLSVPANGAVTYATGRSPGDTVTYSCDTCYAVGAGNSVRTCQADGQWNGTAPSCSLVDADYFIGLGNSCYLFDPAARISWADAKRMCASKNAKLIEIESANEQTFIEGHLDAGPEFWWLGGQDLDGDGNYVWDSTNAERNDWLYDNFYSTEPNNFSSEKCMVLWKDNGYQWGNHLCGGSSLQAYICEWET